MSVTAERVLEESVTFHTAKSFCWAWLLVTFSYPALAAPIYQETLQGNGETRLLIERSLNVAESGRYFLTLKNGDLGPRNIEQCESEDTVSAKRECLFENLNERIEQNFTRMRDALIHVNGVRVRHSLAPNERTITQARGLLKIPVELTQGVNTLKVDYLLIIYSSGSGKDAPRAIRTISNLPLGSGPIESEWNTRSLKQGTIPIVHPPPVINPVAPIPLCLLKSDGSTIGEAGDLPILHPDNAVTHLDHYHLSITGR